MDKRRLPATLQHNRTDIQVLNERANLIKIINNRENNINKRKELLGEYNEIMKRLFKSQQKKKAKLRAGRGGVRTSRAWENRQQERYKRGERRAEGKDETEIIGEEIKKDAMGNIQITYRDYDKEKAEKDADLLRLENIRNQDIQLRIAERADKIDYNRERDRENLIIQREFRDKDDEYRLFKLKKEEIDDGFNRIFKGEKLDLMKDRLSQGEDFMSVLQQIDDRFNRRFDAAEIQFRNLLQTNPNGVEIQNLKDNYPEIEEWNQRDEDRLGAEPEEATPPNRPISNVSQPDEDEPVGETPKARVYAEGQKRVAVGNKRTYEEDLDKIREMLEVPKAGTPERLQFDIDLTSGELEGMPSLIQGGLSSLGFEAGGGLEQEVDRLKREAVADRKETDELRARIEQDKKSLLEQNYQKLKTIPENRDLRQDTLDGLEVGETFTDKSGETVGFVNPLMTPVEKADFEKFRNAEGLYTVGSPTAEAAGIVQSPRAPGTSYPTTKEGWTKLLTANRREREEQFTALKEDKPELASSVKLSNYKEINFTNLKREDLELWKQLVPIAEKRDKANKAYGEWKDSQKPAKPPVVDVPINPDVPSKFVAGKYNKGDEVMYFRDGNWNKASVVDYKSDDAGEAQLAVKWGNKTIDTIDKKIVPIPNDGDKLQQRLLRGELKDGIYKGPTEGTKKETKTGPFWEDKNKYLIHNNTDFEFRGIAPKGKSIINYHKEHSHHYDEHTYNHTPLDADGGWGNQRVIHPRYLEPALESGLLRLEYLESPLPKKEGKKVKLPVGGQVVGFQEAVAEGSHRMPDGSIMKDEDHEPEPEET